MVTSHDLQLLALCMMGRAKVGNSSGFISQNGIHFVFKNLLHFIPSGFPINLKDPVCGTKWVYACELGGCFGGMEHFHYPGGVILT